MNGPLLFLALPGWQRVLCCTANSCYIPENNRSLSADKPVDFEQIK